LGVLAQALYQFSLKSGQALLDRFVRAERTEDERSWRRGLASHVVVVKEKQSCDSDDDSAAPVE